MAYFPKKDQQDQIATMSSLGPSQQVNELAQQQQQQGGTEAPVGGAAPSSTAATQPSAAPKATKGSGMGADIRKYVTQNRPQSISQGVQKATESQAQAVGQQVQKQQSDFAQRVQQQRQMQESAFQKAQQSLQAAQSATGTAETPLTSEQVKAFQSAQNLRVQAPELDLTGARAQQQQLGQIAQQAASGRKSELLRQAFGQQGRQYTTGQSALDELILSGDKKAGEQLVTQAQQAAKTQQEAIDAARRQAMQQIGGLQAGVQDIRSQLTSGVDVTQENLRKALEERLGATPDIRTAIQENKLTQAMLDELGLEGGRTYGVDPLKYLKQATTSSVATPEELARARALAQLEGSQQDIILDPTQVGQEDVRGIQALQDIIAERRGEYEQAQVAPTQQLKALRQAEQMARARAADAYKLSQISEDNYNPFISPRGEDDIGYYDRAVADLKRAQEEAAQFQNYISQFNPEQQAALQRLQSDLARSSASHTYASAYAPRIQQTLSGLLSPYQQTLANLEQQYGGQLTAAPVAAEDGAVKHSTAELLRKLLKNK